MCPVCNTTLDQSSSPAARQIKTFISQRIAAGASKDEIKDSLVSEYGPQILAAPPKNGFNLLAWLLPILGLVGGAVVLAALAWRWSREREPVAGARRPRSRHSSGASTRSSPASTRTSSLERIPLAFLAGLVSVITPCVLPLVPGYLSAISAIEADRLGEPGAARRVAFASLPFIAGFTVVFVLLGAGAAAIGGVLDPDLQTELAGLILVVLGLTFVGLLPWPERVVAPGLLAGARKRGSSVLLGAAFAVCAAPCIGTVLASILVAGRRPGTVLRGAVLLAAYSAGLGLAFLLAAVAFTQAMGALPLAPRPLPGDPGCRRADARCARPAPLLSPRLVASRVPEPAAERRRARGRLAGEGRASPAPEPPRPGSAARRRRRRDARGERPEPAHCLLELPLAARLLPRPAWYQATTTWTRP